MNSYQRKHLLNRSFETHMMSGREAARMISTERQSYVNRTQMRAGLAEISHLSFKPHLHSLRTIFPMLQRL